MKPTQEQILNSLSKLIKSEGKVKVELGIADDIKKIEHEIYSVDEKLLIKDILAPLRKAIVKFEGVAKLESKLSTEIKKAKAALKDLGISEKNIPWVERAERSLDLTKELGESAANLSKIEKMI